MKTLRIFSISLCALTFSACFSVRHSYQGEKFLTSAAEAPGLRSVPVRHFALHDRQFFWIHGGFPVGEPLNGAALAAGQIGEHDGVVNLRIRDGQDIADLAVSHIPCVLQWVCGMWSVWVEGDVVDFEEVKP
jgi:hypothetical protein